MRLEHSVHWAVDSARSQLWGIKSTEGKTYLTAIARRASSAMSAREMGVLPAGKSCMALGPPVRMDVYSPEGLAMTLATRVKA